MTEPTYRIVHQRPERGVHSSPYIPTPDRRAEGDTAVVLQGPIIGDVSMAELTDHERAELVAIRQLRDAEPRNLVCWANRGASYKMVRKHTHT